MSFPSITTILNNAPLIIQGASKLIDMIRERSMEKDDIQEPVNSLETLKDDLDRIQNRLQANDEANIQQIKLIEELAKQNEALAGTIQKSSQQLKIISILAVIALLISVCTLVYLLK